MQGLTKNAGCRVSQMLALPAGSRRLRAAAWPQFFQPLLDPPSPCARSVLPLEKGTTFAHRKPMIHVGGLGSSWSQKFQWASARLAFPLYTHFPLTH